MQRTARLRGAGAALLARARWAPRLEERVLGCFLLLVVAAVWLDLPGRFTPDTVPALYSAPHRLLRDDLSAWVPDPYLGQPALQLGRAPVSAFLLALSELRIPDWALVRCWQSLLLITAALGAYVLYRRWSGAEGSRAGAVAMAVVFTANPYVVVGGSTTPTLLPYALLPLLVIALLAATTGRGWSAPAAFALVFFAMSGIQVGVVPILQLLVVPVVVLDARLRIGVPWRTALFGVLRCGLLALAVSLYWLLPALNALALGTQIAGVTESTEAIASSSSPAEVLRGLGMWTMYGRGPDGPFQPGFVDYVTSPAVVLASFALPVAAMLAAAVSRSRLRLPAVLLVAVAVPVMVGVHPYHDPSPFGRLLRRGFDDVPGLIAFRTTNKAGGVLLLGLSLLVALGVERVRSSVRRPQARALLGVVAAVILVGAAAPAVAGPLHPVELPVPHYWREAARALDAHPERGRILVLPGTHVPTYRWGYTSSADIPEALFHRGTVQRQGARNGSPDAADLLAALDTALQEGTLPPGTISSVARYLGVQDVLLRHDLKWEDAAGARPDDIAARAGADPGLQLVEQFGAPGENVVSSRPPPTPEVGDREAALPPLQHFRVLDPLPQVRAESVGGRLLVEGDSSAVPGLLAAGLLVGRPGYQLLADLDARDLEESLRDGARVVLTDTNRRRSSAVGRLTAGTGPTVPATAHVERSVSLFEHPDDQSVAVMSGGSVSATQSGSAFGPVPYGGPALALDGDPRTAWLAGDFGTAVGQRLDVRLDRPAVVSRILLRPLDTMPGRLAAVRVRIGRAVRDVQLPAGTETAVEVTPQTTRAISVTVTRVDGRWDGAVGLAELRVVGVDLVPSIRLPRTLDALAARLSARGRTLLDRSPLDVVLTRSRGMDASAVDDEETRLSRDFSTIGSRVYDAGGLLRAGPDAPETDLDLLAGYDPAVQATSTSRFFDDASLRASRALDGDPGTAWVPGRSTVGESLSVTFPPHKVDHVVVRQEQQANSVVDLMTRVRVELDDGRSVDADVGPGATTLALPPGGDARRLTLTVLGRKGVGVLVRLDELEVPGVTLKADPRRAAAACIRVATLSGSPIAVHADEAALSSGRQSAFSYCGRPIRLGEGRQQLRTSAGWLLDRVHLRDLRPDPGPAPVPAPRVSASSGKPTAWRVKAGSSAPYDLVLGQGWDPGWRAVADGKDLGPPIALDGWSAGWRVQRPGPGVIDIVYRPQRLVLATRAVSSLALAGCFALLLVGWRRRRKGRSVPVHARATGPALPVRSGAARRGRGVAAWALCIGLLWLVGGTFLGGAGAVLAVVAGRSSRAARALPWVAAVLLAFVVDRRLADGLGSPTTVSPDLVSGGLSEHLALLSAALLVVGVLAQELPRRGEEGPP